MFDVGFITFTDDGYILRADPEVDFAMKKWGLDPDMNIGEFNSEQKKFIKHHKKYVYNQLYPIVKAETKLVINHSKVSSYTWDSLEEPNNGLHA